MWRKCFTLIRSLCDVIEECCMIQEMELTGRKWQTVHNSSFRRSFGTILKCETAQIETFTRLYVSFLVDKLHMILHLSS